MGQMFCALVLLYVIFSVDAWSSQRNSEHEDTLCSQDHPLYPYVKLFNVIPEEWKSENNNNSEEKKPVCFTKTLTTETDDNGKELNKFSSYEITFGLPKKYVSHLASQKHSDDDPEFVNYPPFDEITKKDDITTKNVVHTRCSKNNEEPNTTPAPEFDDTTNTETTSFPTITTINHDLDFMNDLDDICDEHFDIDVLRSLPHDDEITPEPDFGNTRRSGGDLIDFTTDIPDASTTETEGYTSTEFATIQPEEVEDPNILSRMDGTPFAEITTEISNLITIILKEINDTSETTTLPTTSQPDVSSTTLKDDEITTEQTVQPEITTQEPVTEEVRRSSTVFAEEVRRNDEHNAFVIQMKNIVPSNSQAECYIVDSIVQYGKCGEPIIPIRILTESTLPKNVKLELVKNLENNKDINDYIVSGRKNCYLLKNLTTTECPADHDAMATVLEIDDLPDNPHDDPYFTVEFEGKCTTVSKYIDVIECPIYEDTLPHLQTNHLPDHVRLKHSPGKIDVHVDDIIVHSFSHCLLLKGIKDIECRNRPNIVLKEDELPEYYKDDIRTTEIINDDDNLPTYRLGDYSLEKLSDIYPKSYHDSVEQEDLLTTPCGSDEDDEINPISRTTRTLSYPTTEAPVPNRRTKTGCEENDLDCLIGIFREETDELKTRRTIQPDPDINNTKDPELTTPAPTTITPTTEVTEITIPNSRKLSKLLKTILDESTNENFTRTSDLFKPDFIVKIACARNIDKTSCFYVSKYVMQPTFDDPNDYDHIIDKSKLPEDVKMVRASNLNIFEANETIYTTSGKEKFVLIKKEAVDCPTHRGDSFFILDTGSCGAERRDEIPETKSLEPSIVKYQKGSKVYCFDFDEDLRLYQVKCPENLSRISVLSRPEDLKTLCRSQMKKKGHNEQMKLLRRLNIVTDYN